MSASMGKKREIPIKDRAEELKVHEPALDLEGLYRPAAQLLEGRGHLLQNVVSKLQIVVHQVRDGGREHGGVLEQHLAL